MYVLAAPALGGVIGTAGSITYKDVTSSLMTNEDVEIQMDCSAAKSITGVGFGTDFLNLDPQALRMYAANSARIRVSASGNDNLTAYTMYTSAKVKYVEASKQHLAGKGLKPDDGWKATTSGLQAATVDATAACSPVEPKYTRETTTVSPSVTTAVVPNCKGATNLASVWRAPDRADPVRLTQLDAPARR